LSVIAVASTLLLTSCSNPDTSGGVTLAKGGDDANEFPHGGCDGFFKNPATYDTGCGWMSINDKRYYIYPGIYLNDADLTGANLKGANLSDAEMRSTNLKDVDLSGANLEMADMWGANLVGTNLTGAKLYAAMLIDNNLWCETICPNGIHWGVKGNNCAEFRIGPKGPSGHFEPIIDCACDPTHC
jgi:hypothetical protein